MSNHLLAYHRLENERLDLIERFAFELEGAIDQLVAERVAEAIRRQPPPVQRARIEGAMIARRFVSQSPRPVVQVPAPLPRTPTIIPDNIHITRLPPGPSPHEKKRAGPPMDCRCPGCLVKSRGPRYEYFCEDHYRILNAEERSRYAAMWREARARRG